MIVADFAPGLAEAVSGHFRQGAQGDVPTVADNLRSLVETGTLRTFVETALDRIGANPDHRIEGVVSQTTLAVHRDEDWEYVISLIYPDAPLAARHVWSGDTGIIVSECGTARYTRYRVPARARLDTFEAGLVAQAAPPARFGACHAPVISDSREFVEVRADQNAPDILHIVTLKNPRARSQWVFDRSLTALHAENASITASRLMSILDVYDATGQPYPDTLLERCLNARGAQLPIELVSRLLVNSDPRAFGCIERMIASSDPDVIAEALAFFDYLLVPERSHAS